MEYRNIRLEPKMTPETRPYKCVKKTTKIMTKIPIKDNSLVTELKISSLGIAGRFP
jgi:hypothetical protein